MTSPTTPTLPDGSAAWPMAVMGGAYGNVPALQACLHDARAQGCRTMAFIGDAIGCCGHSAEILAMVYRHFSILVAGNHEQQAATGQTTCACGYASAEDETIGCQAFALALRDLSEDHRRRLRLWPSAATVHTPAGAVLLCHGSPERTNEFLCTSQFSPGRWRQFLESRNLVGFVCTHTGLPWTHRVGPTHFAANCGVVGKPDHDAQPAVHYATLHATPWGAITIAIREVRYNHGAWAKQLRGEGVPNVLVAPLETGIWTTGLSSLPESERLVHSGQRCCGITIRPNRRQPGYERTLP